MYTAKKDEENALLAQYKEEQFGSYLGGQVTGGIATLPLGGLFGLTRTRKLKTLVWEALRTFLSWPLQLN